MKAVGYDQHHTRHQFVFVRSCGCPVGVVEGSYAKTEDGAWDMMADDRQDERRMRAAGITVDHVSHAEYCERYSPLMTQNCTHAARTKSEVAR